LRNILGSRGWRLPSAREIILASLLTAGTVAWEYSAQQRAEIGRAYVEDSFPVFLSRLDTSLFLSLRECVASPLLDAFFYAVTLAGSLSSTVLLWGILFISGRRRESAVVLSSVGISSVATAILKSLIARPRPLAVLGGALIASEAGGSFPSGHAARIFSLTALLGGLKKPLRVALLALTFLVAISRVYLGAHYPLDVVGGAALGLAAGRLVKHYESLLVAGTSRIMARIGVWRLPMQKGVA
jgi:undecaprenyl-diphosphatase